MEEKIALLESNQKADEPARSADLEASEPADLEQLRREEKAQWEGTLRAHQEERRDPVWAGKAEGLFRADFAAMVQGRTFEALGVDCRENSCVATLQWPSYSPEVVRQDARFIAGYPQQENCITTISVPPPENPEDLKGSYRAEVVYDCSSLRAATAHR